MDEEIPLNVKIKLEKVTPEREEVKDSIEKLLDSNLFGGQPENDEQLEKSDDKKEIEISKWVNRPRNPQSYSILSSHY